MAKKKRKKAGKPQRTTNTSAMRMYKIIVSVALVIIVGAFVIRLAASFLEQVSVLGSQTHSMQKGSYEDN